jgi:hypothetical protein
LSKSACTVSCAKAQYSDGDEGASRRFNAHDPVTDAMLQFEETAGRDLASWRSSWVTLRADPPRSLTVRIQHTIYAFGLCNKSARLAKMAHPKQNAVVNDPAPVSVSGNVGNP